MTEHGLIYLDTKPFSAPPTPELVYCLRSFAHVVEHLDLDVRAQVLDGGCGPGWLSEFLARCGYWVTGVDIAPEMVAIAERRLDRIESPIGVGLAPVAEFHALRIGEIPWRRRFDVAVLFDALHHFDRELETLRVIRDALVPGGRVFIQESAWPRRGSEGERHFRDEMRRHGTLESPFSPRYLVEVLKKVGFEKVTRLAPIDRLFVARRPLSALRHVLGRTMFPQSNTVVASSPEDPTLTTGFAGRLDVLGAPSRSASTTVIRLAVANRGRRFWPAAKGHPFPVGTISIAPHWRDAEHRRRELPRIELGRDLSPGESIEVTGHLPDGDLREVRELRFDLVREGVTWFEDIGGTVARIRL
jgi:SAM-dependent methyltransferase